MLVTEFYKGQGLGNQLACYVTTRVLALDQGFEFGVMHPERFKGADFMSLDFGGPVIGGAGPEGGPPVKLPIGIKSYVRERSLVHPVANVDIRDCDYSLREISDNTKLDGLLQGEQYILHRKKEIAVWLQTKSFPEVEALCANDVCIINFRGGEYLAVNDFHLKEKYWNDAIEHMRAVNPAMRFVVITDDIIAARKVFPRFQVYHFSIGGDYFAINNASYLILSNSSFAWFPAWLNTKLKFCIAPKYWGRHNVSDGYWSLRCNLTAGWLYLDRFGQLADYEECLAEVKIYEQWNAAMLSEKELNMPVVSVKPKGLRALARELTPRLILESYRGLVNFRRQSLNFIFHNTYLFFRKFSITEKRLSRSEVLTLKEEIKVYDVFYFFNELDLLEIRLNVLDDFVDRFVLVEGAYTFGGVPKASHYKNNIERFAKWNHKIDYYWIENFEEDEELLQLAKTHRNVGDGQAHWVREFYFKECAKKALGNLSDSDVVFISDVDEIWNPMQLRSLTDFSVAPVLRPIQLSYYYFLNNRSNEHRIGWTGTVVCQYRTIASTCVNDLRSRDITKAREIFEGGWHFTYMGGAEGVRKKLREQNHPAYNIYIDTIDQRVNSNLDYAGRNLKYWTDESDLPDYLLVHRTRWKHLFK